MFKPIPCKWCGDVLHTRRIQTHLMRWCKQRPFLKPHWRFCSACQDPHPIENFPVNLGLPGKRAYTCLTCSRQAAHVAKKYKNHHPQRETEYRPRFGARVMKPCSYCGEEFSAREIWPHKAHCSKNPKFLPKPAKKEKAPSRFSKEIRERWLYVRYGITPEQFEAMAQAQGSKCAICNEPPRGKSPQTCVLHVDHNHATKKVRGLLCDGCNRSLGCLREDPALFDAAKQYLLNWRAKHELEQSAH